MLLELRPHVLDDDRGRLSDGLDREARKEEDEHRAEEPSQKHLRLGEVDRLQLRAVVLQLIQVRREEEKGRERGRADRVSLGQGLRRVSDGVEPVGLLADLFGLTRHLDDPAGVVRDRPERVHRQDVRRRAEHAHRRDRGAEEPSAGSAETPIL